MSQVSHHHRVIFFLGPHFGTLFLKKVWNVISASEFRVVSYSQESDSYYGYENVVAYCANHNIEFMDTSRSMSGILDFCKHFDPTIIICGYYARVLPTDILELPRYGAYNVHPGRLPCYRGPFPTAWAILNDEQEFGITIHKMDSGIDTGPIVAQKICSIHSDETGFQLYKRSMDSCAKLLYEKLEELLKNDIELIEQHTIGIGSYFGKIEEYHRIEWGNTCARIRNQVRVHSKPYFPAYSFMKNKMLLVNACRLTEQKNFALQGPGKVICVNSDNTFRVSCGDGVLEIMDYDICPLSRNEKGDQLLKVGLRLR